MDTVIKPHTVTVISLYTDVQGDRGNTVVKVLRYNLEGRWFDSR